MVDVQVDGHLGHQDLVSNSPDFLGVPWPASFQLVCETRRFARVAFPADVHAEDEPGRQIDPSAMTSGGATAHFQDNGCDPRDLVDAMSSCDTRSLRVAPMGSWLSCRTARPGCATGTVDGSNAISRPRRIAATLPTRCDDGSTRSRRESLTRRW